MPKSRGLQCECEQGRRSGNHTLAFFCECAVYRGDKRGKEVKYPTISLHLREVTG